MSPSEACSGMDRGKRREQVVLLYSYIRYMRSFEMYKRTVQHRG